ncbi:MAG: fused MFS/spermidine synthase [Betaproteobacteria bacterium]
MVLYPLTVFLSAFLLFLLQPVIAKQILPWFGGSAGVWTTCLFFFQFVLLCGYAYAHWSIRTLRPKPQAILHILLLLTSLASLPILAQTSWKPEGSENPSLRILGLLLATVGLPYFMLTTTGPLMQAWYARITESPYRLFALSNFASLLGLLCYPFLLEPLITTKQQAWYWSAGHVAFVILCTMTALYSLRRTRFVGAVTATPMTEERPPSVGRRCTWIVLAATGSYMLLATTNHMTQNIASMPLLWVLPLTLYLLTFILCFEGRGWYHRLAFLGPLLAALGGMVYVDSELSIMLNIKIALPVFAAGLFAICMFCHGELAALKPAPRYLTGFFLMVSLGGAIGSLLVSVVAPLVLPAEFEMQIGLIGCTLLVLWQTRREPLWVPALAAIIAAGVNYGVISQTVEKVKTYRVMVRNFYGALHTKDNAAPSDPNARRQLIHGVIEHGDQFLAPEKAGEPLSYYGRGSGIGLASAAKSQANRRIAVVGLGAGTIAAYGRPGDLVKFYEINPQVVGIARSEFTYLSGSKAQIEIALGDARLSLEREPAQRFDLLAVDAFSSDAIPVHLLTRQAFDVYLRHLNADGILAIHVTNRYLDLAPVVKDIADALGLAAVHIEDEPEEFLARTDWVLVSRQPAQLEQPPIAASAKEIPSDPSRRVWTDDFNNLFKAMKKP